MSFGYLILLRRSVACVYRVRHYCKHILLSIIKRKSSKVSKLTRVSKVAV
jgi:hypothetical protein